jgi:hypothetical protein
MADHSHIEWTDATWNPITGCSVVSPGCTNCYAMKLAGTRLKHHPSRARPSRGRGGRTSRRWRGRRCSGPGGGCAGSARCAAPRRASAATGRSRWSRRRGGSSAGAAARAATWSTSSWRSGAGRCARRRCGCAGWRWRPTRPLRLGLAPIHLPRCAGEERGGAGGARDLGGSGRYLSRNVAWRGYLRARGIARAWARGRDGPAVHGGAAKWGWDETAGDWIRRRRSSARW